MTVTREMVMREMNEATCCSTQEANVIEVGAKDLQRASGEERHAEEIACARAAVDFYRRYVDSRGELAATTVERAGAAGRRQEDAVCGRLRRRRRSWNLVDRSAGGQPCNACGHVRLPS